MLQLLALLYSDLQRIGIACSDVQISARIYRAEIRHILTLLRQSSELFHASLSAESLLVRKLWHLALGGPWQIRIGRTPHILPRRSCCVLKSTTLKSFGT